MARLKRKVHLTALPALFLAVFSLLPASFSQARADRPPGKQTASRCAPPLLKTAIVKEVGRDGTLHLQTGERVRLAGIMPVRHVENATSPLARKLNRLALAARELLRRKLKDQTVTLRQRGRQRDRYDRILAHVFASDGAWLQGHLLSAGLARGFSHADNHACMSEMLALEEKARQARRGLWRYRLFQPQPALQRDRLLRKRYRFTLVEGRVRKVARVKKWLFLNFGDNWRDDFTIAIRRKHGRKIERDGLDLHALAGKRIRVRGWIERWNGPLIKVTHKQQIELLDDQ